MSNQQQAFELAVRTWHSELFRYAYWLCRRHSDADDIVQEALLRAWRNWASVRELQALKRWLFVIVRREFLRRVGNRLPVLESDEVLQELPAPGLHPDDALALHDALAQLPATLREALVLQVLGGFSCEEIADMLQTSEGAVTTRVSRARQWLRRLYASTESTGPYQRSQTHELP